MGYYAGAIHGDFTQSHRDEMMGKFKKEISIFSLLLTLQPGGA